MKREELIKWCQEEMERTTNTLIYWKDHEFEMLGRLMDMSTPIAMQGMKVATLKSVLTKLQEN